MKLYDELMMLGGVSACDIMKMKKKGKKA